METKLDIITAADALALAVGDPASTARLNHFFGDIRRRATESGARSMHYTSPAELGDITPVEIDYLRSLGYSIFWDERAKWYDVSWRDGR